MKPGCLLSLLFFLSTGLLASSQQVYYYAASRKIPLTLQPDKVGFLYETRPDSRTAAYRDGSVIERTIRDRRYEIDIIDLTQSEISTSAREAATWQDRDVESDKIFRRLPVYTGRYGQELVTMPYLHVRLKSENDLGLLDSMADFYGLERLEPDTLMPFWYTLCLTFKTELLPIEIANALFESGRFASAFPDFFSEGSLCVSEPDFGNQWGLSNPENPNIDISICEAWEVATGKGVNIAIVDVGINLNHPDLVANKHPLSYNDRYKSGWDDGPGVMIQMHGTHCAGIAGAAINGKYMAGVAPEAKIMAVTHASTAMSKAKCISWAWRNGADVISCSWWELDSEALMEVLDSALIRGREGKGAVVVFAAGNLYGDSVWFPANYRPEIIAVSAINKYGELAGFSSLGKEVDVCAPGEDIYSTYGADGMQIDSGTSMACPHVAGLAALLLEIDPDLSGQEVRNIIERTVKKVGTPAYRQESGQPNGTWNEKHGYGLIDAYAAVRAICPETDFVGRTVSKDAAIDACRIKVKNVEVKKGAKLTLDARRSTVIEGEFKMEAGAELEIR